MIWHRVGRGTRLRVPSGSCHSATLDAMRWWNVGDALCYRNRLGGQNQGGPVGFVAQDEASFYAFKNLAKVLHNADALSFCPHLQDLRLNSGHFHELVSGFSSSGWFKLRSREIHTGHA